MSDEKPRALVCNRLIDMTVVHPAQVARSCSRCGLLVGVYPSGQSALKRFPDMKIVCARCASLTRREEIEAKPAGSWEEIAQEARDSLPVRKA